MLIAAGRPQSLPGRAPLDDVVAWIDAWAALVGPEEVPLAHAAGRVLARDVTAAMDLPPLDRAAADGFAVRADETVGASAYNPLRFRLTPGTAYLAPGAAVAVESGDPLPPGADAVVRLEHAMADAAGTIAIIAPTAAGSEVERAGSQAAHGTVLVAAERQLGPGEIGLLASAGLRRISVVDRPRVRCLLTSARAVEAERASTPGAVYDANGPMLAALIERDGGWVDLCRVLQGRVGLRDALGAPGADLILIAGGTGPGCGDESAAALSEAGEVVIHGVALRPGETAGVGRAGNVPVFLLPGTPVACLWAYELLAGRAVRRLAGRSPKLPFPARTLRAARKIVSEVGTTEVCPVRCTGDDEVEPIAPFAEVGLAAAAQADGFVLVPEASEGYSRGALVTVYLFAERHPAHSGRSSKP
jgi:molybdopterin molybdotransferase